MVYLHHIILHFPIAFGIASLLFAVLGVVMPGRPWREHASVMLVLTALSAVTAAFTGFMAADVLMAAGLEERRLALHRLSAVVATTAGAVAAVWAFLQLTTTTAFATARGMIAATAVIALLVGFAGHNGGELAHPDVSPIHIVRQVTALFLVRSAAMPLWDAAARPLLWPWHAIAAGLGAIAYLAAMFVARAKRPRGAWLKVHKRVNFIAVAVMTAGVVCGFVMVAVVARPHFRVFHSLIGGVTLLIAAATVVLGYAIFRTMVAKEDRPVLRSIHRWAGRTTLVLAFLTIVTGLLRTALLGV
ncbi:MAG: hypothetical protein PHU25_04235 [Deltaproteobacteria bacterium]|nr:hypothetical protein [Deltaproteobacteria bacterium]